MDEIEIAIEVRPERWIERLFDQLVDIFVFDCLMIAGRKEDDYSRTELLEIGEEVYIASPLKIVGEVSQ